jgi:hypothetical protein
LISANFNNASLYNTARACAQLCTNGNTTKRVRTIQERVPKVEFTDGKPNEPGLRGLWSVDMFMMAAAFGRGSRSITQRTAKRADKRSVWTPKATVDEVMRELKNPHD